MIKNLSKIYEAEKSDNLFASMGLTFLACPPIKVMASFSFAFVRLDKSWSLVSKFLRERLQKSLTIRQKSPICLYSSFVSQV